MFVYHVTYKNQVQNTSSKKTKKISSQTWNIKSIMHQGSCHMQNIQICNNEKRDPKHEQIFLNQDAKTKNKPIKLNKKIITNYFSYSNN
jgi:hypothetical protein